LFFVGFVLTALGGIGCGHGGSGCASNPVHYSGLFFMLLSVVCAAVKMYKKFPKTDRQQRKW